MEWNTFDILIGVAALLTAVYYYLTSTFNFWSSLGVPGSKSLPIVGTFKDVALAKLSRGEYLTEEYNKFKNEPFVGLYQGRKPVLLVKDPEYIKDILIKDFSKFAARGFNVYEKVDPLSQHLFLLEPARWRPLRNKLSPIFTSGKLKDMFYLLLDCADHLDQFISEQVEKNPIIECREMAAKFTTDVIGVCAFGLKMNAIAEKDSEFRKVGRRVFESSWRMYLRTRVREFMPWIYQLFGSLFYDHAVNDFFIKTMSETMEYRKKNNIRRKDFVDLLLDLKENPDKIGDFELTDTLMTAQAFVFFIAGFETSSSTISHVLYEMALNPSIQDKLREEIKEELRNNDQKLKYENLKNMKYLDKIFSETLRKYPVGTALSRKSTESYQFVGTKLTIPKDTPIFIPVYAIHHDPKYYPDPDVFDPERFSEENVKQRHPSVYLPFGDGPRNCIGARFGVNQTKIGILSVLKNYKVEVCSETPIPYVEDPTVTILTPLGGIKLKFVKIQ